MTDRYLIEARAGWSDWCLWYAEGQPLAESPEHAALQVVMIADEADEIRVTRFNDETPARDMTEDILWLAFLEWDARHGPEHAVPAPLQDTYEQSNIRRDDPERGN